jgi:hypothetical protein
MQSRVRSAGSPFLAADVDVLTGRPATGLRKIWKAQRDLFPG